MEMLRPWVIQSKTLSTAAVEREQASHWGAPGRIP